MNTEEICNIIEGKFKQKVIRGGVRKKKLGTTNTSKRVDSTGKGLKSFTGNDKRKLSIQNKKKSRKHPMKNSAKIKRAKSMKKRATQGLNNSYVMPTVKDILDELAQEIIEMKFFSEKTSTDKDISTASSELRKSKGKKAKPAQDDDFIEYGESLAVWAEKNLMTFNDLRKAIKTNKAPKPKSKLSKTDLSDAMDVAKDILG